MTRGIPMSPHKSQRTRVRLGIEILERRDLLASGLTANFSAGLLRIDGTESTDQINVREINHQISVDGIQIQSGKKVVAGVNAHSVKKITVYGLAGDDLISIGLSQADAARIAIRASGGQGDDVIL